MFYSCHKQLPSCHATKELIASIEKYLLEKIPGKLGVEEAALKEQYYVRIDERGASTVLTPISEFVFPQFPDRTEGITLGFSLFKPSRCEVQVRFTTDRSSSKISVACEGPNSRALAPDICEDIAAIVAPHVNKNWFFHLGIAAELLLGTVFGVVVGLLVSLLIDGNAWPAVAACLSLLAALLVYFWAGRSIRPYTSFESARTRALESYGRLVYGVLSGLAVSIVASAIWELIRH
jgi:hypothetical protein